ncbi:MAG: hypothetical protein QOD13_595 [Thermoleophilaceae bacterium]|nr:hypothetical protein [Thermoleophilaceae bacterium]
MTALQAGLATLEAKRAAATRLIELRRERLQTAVEEELVFNVMARIAFSPSTSKMISDARTPQPACDSQGGVDFRAEFIGESGTATSGDRGTSYRKLLCIAFDRSVLRAYRDVRFPRFVSLDGALEQLEPRKRENLIGVFRDYAALGLQPVISLLDSDLPAPLGRSESTLAPEDVVLTLHDEGEEGRLFRMPTW